MTASYGYIGYHVIPTPSPAVIRLCHAFAFTAGVLAILARAWLGQ